MSRSELRSSGIEKAKLKGDGVDRGTTWKLTFSQEEHIKLRSRVSPGRAHKTVIDNFLREEFAPLSLNNSCSNANPPTTI